MTRHDSVEAFASQRCEFSEHGGVNMSIKASSTFTVVDPATMPDILAGRKILESGGCYLYGCHFNLTVYSLGRQRRPATATLGAAHGD